MANDQVIQKVASYMTLNLGMLPRTAEMAANRYFRMYLQETSKTEVTIGGLPEMGSWLSDKFLTLGIIEQDSVKKMVDDFRTGKI